MRDSIVTFTKSLLLVATVIFISTSSSVAKGTETLIIKTKIYCDHCKECESCKLRIDSSIRYHKGVRFSKFDADAQTITIEYYPKKTTPQALREAIAKTGYDADDVKADPSAYEKLDGCCKKPE